MREGQKHHITREKKALVYRKKSDIIIKENVVKNNNYILKLK